MNTALTALIEHEANLPPPPQVQVLVQRLRERFGVHALAVLFYGSCRRSHDAGDSLVDLYVLVDDYRAAYRHRLPAWANHLLAPNVYYLEATHLGRTLRAKVAVVSLEQFERGTSNGFQPYFWGRFAQPCSVLHTADEIVARRLKQALGQAVVTFAQRVVPCLPERFDARSLWTQGLLMSYATELRAEQADRIRALYADSRDELDARARAVAEGCGWSHDDQGRYRNPTPAPARRRATRAWLARRVLGKLTSPLRLLKASFTFDGGITYIAWKIERHSGVKIDVTPLMQRFPRLSGLGAFWRIWWQGGFR